MTARYYYEINKRIYYLDEKTGEFGSKDSKDKKKDGYFYYELFKGYDANNDGLLTYRQDFKNWVTELKQEGIYYDKYYCHTDAVILTFKRYAKREIDTFDFETPDAVEFSYMEKCYNAGLIYFNDKYKDKPLKCYGYDFKAYYPSIFCAKSKTKKHFQIPTKRGQECKISNIDFNAIQYGIYAVKIECDNEEFKKIFRFSKHNYYTHYSLWFCNHYKDKYGIKMTLNIDVEYNAYLYNNEDLIYSDDLFINWYNKMIYLKNKYPKNKLVKHLFTSLWGYLSQYNRTFKYEDEIENMDVSYDINDKCEYTILKECFKYDNGLKTLYELYKTNEPYKYPYARFKPFLLSLSRNIIGMYIERNDLNKNLVRIATDGFILTEPFDVEKHFILNMQPIKDDSKTRQIHFSNFITFKLLD